MVNVPAAWSVLHRLWAPTRGTRERTAATALLLLLVVGTAPLAATRGRPSWVPLPRTAQVAEVGVSQSAERPRTRSAAPATGRCVERPLPLPCGRSVLRRELPAPRAPDCC
jgi:hypothetical protein